jgi:HAMP domain-containing protein
MRTRRRLLNIKLTRKHHFHYFGLWVLLTVLMVVGFNVVIYMLIESRWEGITVVPTDALRSYMLQRQLFVFGLLAEAILFSIGVALLAMTTAHRIAGPYMRLKTAFDEVANGNLGYRLRFRKYDRLEDVAACFNRMMDTLRRGSGHSP